MQLLLTVVLGLIPGLFWLWLIYKGNKYRPDPKGLVIRTFVFGMLATILALIIELLLLLPYHKDLLYLTADNLIRAPFRERAYEAFIVAGFTEELIKFFVVRTTIYRSPYFDEPIDGLVYSSSAALGFASLENLFYSFSADWQSILIRSPVTTIGHVVFSAMWGYPLALHKIKKRNAKVLLGLGLLGAMVAHGLYDFLILIQGDSSFNIPLFLGLIFLYAGLVTVFILLMKRGQKISPYKEKNAELLILCPNCRNHVPYYADYCSYCGAKLAENKTALPVFCGKCGSELTDGTNFCPSCGSRMVKKPGFNHEQNRSKI